MYHRPKDYVNASPVAKVESCPFRYGTRADDLSRSTTLAGKKYNIEIKERELTDEEKQVQNIRKVSLLSMSLPAIIFKISSTITLTEKAIAMSLFPPTGHPVTILSRNSNWDTAPPLPDALAQEAMRKGYKNRILLKTGLCYEKKMAVYATVLGT